MTWERSGLGAARAGVMGAAPAPTSAARAALARPTTGGRPARPGLPARLAEVCAATVWLNYASLEVTATLFGAGGRLRAKLRGLAVVERLQTRRTKAAPRLDVTCCLPWR